MAGYIEDRWLTKRKDPETGKRKRTDRYGKGKRYKVAGIPGVRDRSFETLDDAKAWKAKAEHESRAGEFIDPRRGEMTLRDYIAREWLPGQHGGPNSRRNLRNRLKHIEPQLGSFKLRLIGAAQVRAFKVHVEQSVASSYAHDIMSTLRNILDTAVEDRRIPTNPTRSKSVIFPSKKPGVKREAWSRDVVQAMRDLIDQRYRITVILGVGCGLRQGEALGVSADDVDFSRGILHVRRQVQVPEGCKRIYKLPKGEKTREVPMSSAVAAELEVHMQAFPPTMVELPWGEMDAEEQQKHPLLVTSTYGNAVDFKSWNVITWKPALVASGVIPPSPKGSKRRQFKASPKDGFHVLRHTFASWTLQGGEDIVTLSHWLGHESPNITFEHYAHFLPQSGTKGLAAVDALLAEAPPKAPPRLILPTHSPSVIWKP